MGRTPLFRNITRLFRIAAAGNRRNLKTGDLLEQTQEAQFRYRQYQLSRREFLALAGAATGAALLPKRSDAAAKLKSTARIAIIGGGMAGISCATELARRGVNATLYEANGRRLGGRMWSSQQIPGKVIERGGEFIDSDNPLLLHYVKSLGLQLEDAYEIPGDGFYYLLGQRYAAAEIVAEIRQFASRIEPDQKKIGEPTFFSYSANEKQLDHVDLATYLDHHAHDLPLARTVLDLACNIEFG